jgi:hypothetical protein
MENPETYYWIYLTIFIVFVVVIVGGITVYNKTTEKWKVLTMDDEGDLVYATVPGITEAPLDPKLLELDGNLGVTSKIHANQLEIDDTSNFKGKTTFKGELHVENDLENTNTETKFTWGDVQILDGNIKTKSGKEICIGESCLTKDLIDKLKNLSTQLVTNSVKANNEICVGGDCLNNKHIRMLSGKTPIMLNNPNTGNHVLRRKHGHSEVGVWDDGVDDSYSKWNIWSWR